jgi:hypothetical protein
MKIIISKYQWEQVGRKTGWLKKSQNQEPNSQHSQQNIELAKLNKEKLDRFNVADSFSHYWNTNYAIPGKIINVQVNKFGTYILLDGGIEVNDDTMQDFISDERQASKIWARKDFDSTETFCKDCGEKNPKVMNIDFGIGQYEFQGAPGVDKQIKPATKCCESGIEDKYGREQDPEVNVPSKEDYMEDIKDDLSQ